MDFRIFRFEHFVLDPASRELLHDGERVSIPPKSLECLEYLVRNRARAVGRDELISAVWGRADVSDALLAQTLLRARRAVGDTGVEQTTIRTVPRFGYQWVAAVEECERDAVETPTAQAENPDSSTRRNETTADRGHMSQVLSPHRLHIAWMTALALLIGLVGWWVLRSDVPTPVGENLYVVAPVSVDHADAETAWVRLGVMDYIATRLREDGQLSVLPSQRVVALLGPARGNSADASRDLMKATAASHLIETLASRRAGGWRITLTSKSPSDQRIFVGDGASLLSAASQAVQSLLAADDDGRTPKPVSSLDPLDESTQRIDAAMLEGNLSAARAIIAGLPESSRDAAQIRVREGQILFRGGRIDDADSVFSALEARLVQWPAEVQAQTLMGLGAVAVRRRDFPAAERRYAEALAVLGEQGSQELVGNGYNGRGVSRAAQQQFDLALGDFSRARIALGRAGDAPGVAGIDTNLGLLEARRGQWTQALQAFDRAIDVFSRYRIQDNLAAALLGKSRAQLAVVDFPPALQSSEQARELAGNLENPVLSNQIAVLRANILLRTGSLAAATQLLESAAVTASPDDANGIAIELALASDDGPTAMTLARQLQARTATGQSSYLLVRAAIASHQEAGALEPVLEAFWQLDEKLKEGDASDRVDAELARALWQAYRGKVDEAAATFEQVLASMDRSIEPDLRVETLSRYMEFLVATQRLDRATELSGQLEGYAERDYRAARTLALLYRALGDTDLLESARKHMRDLAGERRQDLPELEHETLEASPGEKP